MPKDRPRTIQPTSKIPAIFGNSGSSVLARLARANQSFSRRYPGTTVERQPVHTVYGGGHLFSARTIKRIGELAVSTMELYAPDARDFPVLFGIDKAIASTIHQRVMTKLKAEAVEDYRVDFEDGYGIRTDEEEDAHAVTAAREMALAMGQGTLPPFCGFRIKPLNAESHLRSIRTLGIFLENLLDATAGRLPQNFVITLPKVTTPVHTQALDALLSALEKKRKLRPRSLLLEIMIESPQVIIDNRGRSLVRELVDASAGRCRGAHFGAYDYTSSCEIVATAQTLKSPACDFARHVMQTSLAGIPVMIADGATNLMPIGPHRSSIQGGSLTQFQLEENRSTVYAAWSVSYQNIRHALECGFYQGWDLHPAQIPVRYIAMHAFFAEALPGITARLKAFIEKAAKATRLGDVFDDAATGQGLINFFLRGMTCGAITTAEVEATGLTLEEIKDRSFLRILSNRNLV